MLILSRTSITSCSGWSSGSLCRRATGRSGWISCSEWRNSHCSIVGAFQHTLELEHALISLDRLGLGPHSVLAVPMEAGDSFHSGALLEKRDRKAGAFETGMAFATGFAVVGISRGFLLAWGPIIWGIIAGSSGLLPRAAGVYGLRPDPRRTKAGQGRQTAAGGYGHCALPGGPQGADRAAPVGASGADGRHAGRTPAFFVRCDAAAYAGGLTRRKAAFNSALSTPRAGLCLPVWRRTDGRPHAETIPPWTGRARRPRVRCSS